jgi:addiction module toxin, relE/stbE family
MEEEQEIGKKETSYKITYSSQFKKDYKKFENNKKKIAKIDNTIRLLEQGGRDNIPKYMKPHRLIGNYEGYLECHIESDLLIIWFQFDEETKQIYLSRLGSHTDLFDKKK